MRGIRIAAVAAVVGFAAGVARADGAAKDAWTAFKPGSSATLRMVNRMGGEAGDQPPQETRMTLVSVTDKEYVLKSEMKLAGEWQGSDMTIPRTGPAVDAPKPTSVEEMGEEKLSIDGTDYVCKKTKTVSQGATTITWANKDQGTLKSETTGPGEDKSTFAVTSLAKKVKAAGKDLVCRETKMTGTSSGTETTSVSLTTDSVPGSVVHSETTVRSTGMMITSVTDLTAFEAK